MKFIAQECLERIKRPKGVCNDRIENHQYCKALEFLHDLDHVTQSFSSFGYDE